MPSSVFGHFEVHCISFPSVFHIHSKGDVIFISVHISVSRVSGLKGAGMKNSWPFPKIWKPSYGAFYQLRNSRCGARQPLGSFVENPKAHDLWLKPQRLKKFYLWQGSSGWGTLIVSKIKGPPRMEAEAWWQSWCCSQKTLFLSAWGVSLPSLPIPVFSRNASGKKIQTGPWCRCSQPVRRDITSEMTKRVIGLQEGKVQTPVFGCPPCVTQGHLHLYL